jgi:septal ring factor EnvC (AmiA/AmiB activator)
MRSRKKSEKLASQLESRKKNLAVVEETIREDPSSQEKLDPVKTFLSQKIESIELELRKN